MEEKEKINERYITKLEKHLESSKEAKKYSSDRFDILIISLATTALILSIGFVKDIIKISEVNTTLLKTAWFFFVLAVITNLISQVSGYYASNYDIKVTNNLIRRERGKEVIGNQKRFEKLCTLLDHITTSLNWLSAGFLIVGIVILVCFFSLNF